MIELHYWPTPNGHKITLLLEETGLPYRVVPVNIGRGDQFEPDFLAIAPNNKMPAIIDEDADGGPLALFESGAILTYLADKAAAAGLPRFLPEDARARADAMQWLFWQVGGLGPMAGQTHHFRNYATDKIPYAIDRFVGETNRLYGVLDRRLADRSFVAGEDYTIADMGIYPWIVPHENQGQSLDDFPNVRRWFDMIAARPATPRAYAVGEAVNPGGGGIRTEEERRILFGQTAASTTPSASTTPAPR